MGGDLMRDMVAGATRGVIFALLITSVGAIYSYFKNQKLKRYWRTCIEETARQYIETIWGDLSVETPEINREHVQLSLINSLTVEVMRTEWPMVAKKKAVEERQVKLRRLSVTWEYMHLEHEFMFANEVQRAQFQLFASFFKAWSDVMPAYASSDAIK